MRRIILLGLVSALVLMGIVPAAQAGRVESIDANGPPWDDPQDVSTELDVAVDVAATVAIDTFEDDAHAHLDVINLGVLNPQSRPTGIVPLVLRTWSNKPYVKDFSWTGLVGQGRYNRGRVISADRLVARLWRDDLVPPGWFRLPNGWYTPEHPPGSVDEYVDVSLTIGWSDAVGFYKGWFHFSADQL